MMLKESDENSRLSSVTIYSVPMWHADNHEILYILLLWLKNILSSV